MNHEDAEQDTVSADVVVVIERMLDAFGALERRVIATESQNVERLAEIRQLSLAAQVQQAEIEKLMALNSTAFAKISTILFDLGVPKDIIAAALPPKEGLN